jgi:hypothetical protein
VRARKHVQPSHLLDGGQTGSKTALQDFQPHVANPHGLSVPCARFVQSNGHRRRGSK